MHLETALPPFLLNFEALLKPIILQALFEQLFIYNFPDTLFFSHNILFI